MLMEPNSPRSVRLKKLEQQMAELGLSHSQRIAARQQWNRAESDHLRQLRVLSTSSHIRHQVKGVSIAGFDNIRVLGKGSFGVVRLVTENAATAKVNGHGHGDHAKQPVVSNVDGKSNLQKKTHLQ